MIRFINNVYLTLKTIKNLHVFIFDYLGLLRGDILYKTYNGYEFIARAGTSDKEELVAVMSGFEYDLLKMPNVKCPIIFDVGSYIGDSAIYMSNFFHNECRIYSFEADFDNYRYASVNLNLNNINTTNLFYLAVGKKNGLAYLDKKNRPLDGYRATSKKISGKSVQMKKISDIAKELKLKKIDILKMDIEGGEFEIFNDKKSYEFISKHISYIYLEYHYDFGQKLVTKLMEKLQKDFTILNHKNNLIYLQNKLKVY